MMLPFSRPSGLTDKNENGSTLRPTAIRRTGMKIAYMPDTHGGPYNQPEPSRDAAARFCDQLLAEGIEAERSGFDGIFLPERHHRTETMFPPPLVMLAAYAARTTKVDLGTFVLQPPYYNPMHLAEDVAMI